MTGRQDIIYSQVEADAVIRGDKRFETVGFSVPIGNPQAPRQAQSNNLLRLVSSIYNPADYGKEVALTIAIRRHDGFSFTLRLDRTVLHRVDYQWRAGRKKCVCRPFEMDYKPHVHTYHEQCYRNRRILYLDDLDPEDTFADALQAFLEETHIAWDDRLRTRFSAYDGKDFWGPAAQTSLFPLSASLDGDDDQ